MNREVHVINFPFQMTKLFVIAKNKLTVGSDEAVGVRLSPIGVHNSVLIKSFVGVLVGLYRVNMNVQSIVTQFLTYEKFI